MIESLIERVDLSEAEAEASLDFLLTEASEALISAFLVLLRAKGETFEEVSRLFELLSFGLRKLLLLFMKRVTISFLIAVSIISC